MACSTKIQLTAKKVPFTTLLDTEINENDQKFLRQKYSSYNLKALLKLVDRIDSDPSKLPHEKEKEKALLSLVVHGLNSVPSEMATDAENYWLKENKKVDSEHFSNLMRTRVRASKAFYTMRTKRVFDFISQSAMFKNDTKNKMELSLIAQRIPFDVPDKQKEYLDGIGVHGTFSTNREQYEDVLKDMDENGYHLVKEPRKDSRLRSVIAGNIDNDDENLWFHEHNCVYINSDNNKEPKVIILQKMSKSALESNLNFRVFFRDRVPEYVPLSPISMKKE